MMFLRKVLNMTKHLRHQTISTPQKNDRQRKIPNLLFLVPDIFTGSYGDG